MTVQCVTNRLERHAAILETTNTILRFHRQLSLAGKSRIAHPAAHPVSLDIRPLPFCDAHDGMQNFPKSIFKLSQSVPANEKNDTSDYLPGRTAVTNAIRDISNNLRTKFVA